MNGGDGGDRDGGFLCATLYPAFVERVEVEVTVRVGACTADAEVLERGDDIHAGVYSRHLEHERTTSCGET